MLAPLALPRALSLMLLPLVASCGDGAGAAGRAGGPTDSGVSADAYDSSWGLPACAAQPEPAAVRAGDHAVDRLEATIVTAGGELPARLFAPAGAVGSPLVIVLPGGTIQGERYDWLGALLASHGRAVIVPQRTGSSVTLTWPAEATAALGQGPWASRVDAAALVLIGHSYGGVTTFCNAAPEACPLPFEGGSPPGLAGAVMLAAHAQPMDDPTLASPAPVGVPLAMIGGTRDARVTASQIDATFARVSGAPWRARVGLEGVNHYQLTDCLDPAVDNYGLDQAASVAHELALERAAAVVLAFIDAVEAGDGTTFEPAARLEGVTVEVTSP